MEESHKKYIRLIDLLANHRANEYDIKELFGLHYQLYTKIFLSEEENRLYDLITDLFIKDTEKLLIKCQKVMSDKKAL